MPPATFECTTFLIAIALAPLPLIAPATNDVAEAVKFGFKEHERNPSEDQVDRHRLETRNADEIMSLTGFGNPSEELTGFGTPEQTASCLAGSVGTDLKTISECDAHCAEMRKGFLWSVDFKRRCRCVEKDCLDSKSSQLRIGRDDGDGEDRKPTEIIQDTPHCKVLAPLWRHALKLLSPDEEMKEASCDMIEWFSQPSCNEALDYGTPCSVTLAFQKSTLTYEKIFKNANHAIVCNLQHLAGIELSYSLRRDDIDSVGELGSDNLHFTLIRNPISRFVSGFSELEVRHSKGDWDGASINETWRDAEDMPRAFLIDLLAGRLAKWAPNSHIFLQTPTLAATNATVLGRLEDFDVVWSHVLDITGQTPSAYDNWSTKDCGQHPESAEGNADRDAMDALLKSDTSAQLALGCAFLLPDYVCLRDDYAAGFFAAANKCVSGGFAADADEWSLIVAKVRNVFCPLGVRSDMLAVTSAIAAGAAAPAPAPAPALAPFAVATTDAFAALKAAANEKPASAPFAVATTDAFAALTAAANEKMLAA